MVVDNLPRGCHEVPHLPRRVPVVFERWMVVNKDVCDRWWLTKMCVKDGGWQRCVWQRVVDKVVCERWWLTKMCVKDGGWQRCVWQRVVDKDVCERWWLTKLSVKECGWQRWAAEAAAEAAAGYRIKNKNPTQRCGEKNISSGKMNMVRGEEYPLEIKKRSIKVGNHVDHLQKRRLCNHRRKFRSQTSDNMDRWKAEQGRGREKEEED